MDIYSHALSGMVVALTINSMAGAPFPLMSALLLGGLAGVAPDADALSLAPGFDATVGRWLGLAPGREIYGGSWWYSHHNALHSLLAALLAAPVLAGLLRLQMRLVDRELPRKAFRPLLAMAIAALAWTAHLVGDLPTPGSVWGGVRLLWPSSAFFGGWGSVWWWNNYDLTLLLSLAFVSLVALHVARPEKARLLPRIAPPIVLLLCLFLCAWQVSGRARSYAYSGDCPDFAGWERASIEEQRRILPAPLFQAMVLADKALPGNF